MDLLNGYSDEEIEKAKEFNNLLKQKAKLESEINTLSLAVRQTLMVNTPERILPDESDFPMSLFLGERKTLPPHPLYIELYRVAHMMEDEKTEDEIREDVIEAMSVKTLLLAFEAKEVVDKIKELNAEL